MKKIFLLIASMILFASTTMAFADVKVAVIDVQQVIQGIPQVQALQDKLKKQFGPQEQNLNNAQKQLQSDVDKYKKDQAVMKDSDKKAMQDKIVKEQDKLRGMQIDFQKQVIAAQNDGMQAILKDIENAVNAIAKDQKFNLILVKASVAYNDANMDITNQVITALKNKK